MGAMEPSSCDESVAPLPICCKQLYVLSSKSNNFFKDKGLSFLGLRVIFIQPCPFLSVYKGPHLKRTSYSTKFAIYMRSCNCYPLQLDFNCNNDSQPNAGGECIQNVYINLDFLSSLFIVNIQLNMLYILIVINFFFCNLVFCNLGFLTGF